MPGTSGLPGAAGVERSRSVCGQRLVAEPQPAAGQSPWPALVTGPVACCRAVRYSPRFASLALILSVLVAACAPAPSGAPPSPLAAFYHQHLDWHACAGGQCATLRVPLDYSHPGGAVIGIAVFRAASTRPQDRIGSLVVNPGGPGASGIDFAREAASFFPAEVRQRFDIVGFDPRGVDRSDPIQCLSNHQLDVLTGSPAYPTDAAEQSQLVSLAKQLASSCQRRYGILLDHVSTLDVARDMDILRAALGESKLTYYGASYGTFLGTIYAEHFAKRIRAMVLDSALNPALSAAEDDLQQAESFEHLLDLFITWCTGQADCPLGSTPQAAMARLQALIQQVDRKPLPGLGDRGVGTGPLITALAGAMYAPESGFPVLEQALAQALAGDGSLLFEIADSYNGRNPNGQYSNLIVSNIAINCVDRPYARAVQAYAAKATQAEQMAPVFGAAIAWGDLPCAFWPARPELTPAPARDPGGPPVLIVDTENDPATPYQWGAALSHQLSQARLLTYDGEGHVAIGRDACVDEAIATYLTSLRLPPAAAVCQ